MTFYGDHPGIIAGKGEGLEVATTAIFSRFPTKNPENATFVKSGSATGHHFLKSARECHKITGD